MRKLIRHLLTRITELNNVRAGRHRRHGLMEPAEWLRSLGMDEPYDS